MIFCSKRSVFIATLALTMSLSSFQNAVSAEVVNTASDVPLALSTPPSTSSASSQASSSTPTKVAQDNEYSEPTAAQTSASTGTTVETKSTGENDTQRGPSVVNSASATPSSATSSVKHQLFKYSADSKDSASAYVSSVFDRLQTAWEEQAYQDSAYPSEVLTFTLNEDGTLSNTTSNNIPPSLLQSIQQKGSFAPFPAAIKGQQLEIKAQLTPDSIELLGYRQIKNPQKDSVITYLSPETNQQSTSLFYMRALPATVGQVKANSDSFSSGSSNSEMSQYVNMVQQQVQRNWRLASDYPFQKTSALLMIDRNGELLGAQLQHSSGDKVADEAALNAIYTAGPFPKAPADVPSLPIIIETIFEPMAAPVKE